MARSIFSDYLQVFPFWLLDIAPIEGASLPIFNPISGFSSITAPGMTLETYEVNEGNGLFHKNVIRKGSIEPMTLTRGVTFWDSDFYRWSVAGLTGDPTGFQTRNIPLLSIGGVTPRRNLMLVHFFARYPGLIAAGLSAGVMAGGIPSVGALGAGVSIGLSAGINVAGAVAASALGTLGIGPFEFAPRIPAKAWLLHDCIPTRFKSGSDFDAASGDISIAEIEIQPEMIEEISLAG